MPLLRQPARGAGGTGWSVVFGSRPGLGKAPGPCLGPGCVLTRPALGATLAAMAIEQTPEKSFYTLAEVAEICDRPPALIRRWVHRRQLAVVWLDDAAVVPVPSLRTRLAHPHRLERELRGRPRLPSGEDRCSPG